MRCVFRNISDLNVKFNSSQTKSHQLANGARLFKTDFVASFHIFRGMARGLSLKQNKACSDLTFRTKLGAKHQLVQKKLFR